ncbi:MAG: Gldg family protein [Gammaproteobacteria bacterium]|nr:Gldg family protein [Gammaproteobacteria bacterium]
MSAGGYQVMLKARSLYSVYGLLAVLVLLLAINLVSGMFLKNVKVDMTADRLYTLSEGTQNILAKLDQPVTLKFYFSEKSFSASPDIATYGKRVRELLEEYASLSNGNIKLLVKNPEPFSDEEAEAMYYRLQGIPVDAAGELAYFGLAGLNSAGDWKAVSYFQLEQEESLEYELSKLIYSMTNPVRPVVGLLSKLPIDGSAANAFVGKSNEWFILSQLKRSFDVQTLDIDVQSIPENIDVLMVVHPRQLDDKTLFAIDQFVLAGGRALIFLDAFSEADVSIDKITGANDNYSTPIKDSNPVKLLDAWGVELVQGFVAGDRGTATRIKSRVGGLEKGEVDYVAWLTLSNQNFNSMDFVTSKIKSLVMASAGILRNKHTAGTQFLPLVESSDQSMAIDAASIQFFTSPEELLQMYIPGGEPYTLAARVTGNVKSAFPDGIEGVDKTKQLIESTEPINIIIVADTDMLRDMFWVDFQDFYGKRAAVPRADNDTFIINAVDNLSGSNDLINLRSRGRSARPFVKVANLRAEADQEYRIKERILQEKLSETGYRIKQLQQKATTDAGQLSISPQQLEVINQFRAEHIEIRKQLRNVQHALSKDIETLGVRLKIINIVLIPALMILLAIVLGIIRLRRAAVNR